MKHISAALSGKNHDFTSGSIRRAVFLLSIPMVLEMGMESIFAIADIYFVDKLGSEAIAAVGITESLITIVYAIAVGLSMAATAMVARRIGENNPEAAAKAGGQAIITGLFLSLLIAIPGFFYSKELLELMGASAYITENYSGYTAIMLSTNLVIMLLFINNAMLRSAGDAALSLRVLIVANLLNIILDPCLIFGLGPFPELGVKGAAIATSIGRGTAVVYQLYLLFGGRGKIKLSLKHLIPDFSLVRRLLKLSVGTVGQFIIATSSWIGLIRILSEFGSDVVAGYTVGIRILIFVLLPSLGISNAASALVGQNLGADKPDRAEKSVWLTAKINVIYMGLIGILFILFPDIWVSLLTSDPEVIRYGAESIHTMSFGFIAYGLGMVLVHAFNGAGDTMSPMAINFLCFWMLEIPLAYFLAIYSGWGQSGVFWSIVIAETLMTLIALILFRKGKWKLKKV
ncbi:MAG: MATE family efflux transporter [Candidatus Kapabacteria bacterium]|jgi:putative MATE family efflux protein|nr:MATE family efflux transporter [Candidatus Kapabacteria bacterium]